MRVNARKRFLSDVSQITSLEILDELEAVVKLCEKAKDLEELPQFKRLKGFKKYGRIRISDHRIGVIFSENTITFCCLLHRKIVYKRFP